LLDRFDLRITVARPEASELLRGAPAESSAVVAERVAAARALAKERETPPNAELSIDELEQLAVPGEDAAGILANAVANGRLSARGLARVRAVARTLADLDGHRGPVLSGEHVALALAMRQPVLAAAPGTPYGGAA
jgi:magnesium chelatase family protein